MNVMKVSEAVTASSFRPSFRRNGTKDNLVCLDSKPECLCAELEALGTLGRSNVGYIMVNSVYDPESGEKLEYEMGELVKKTSFYKGTPIPSKIVNYNSSGYHMEQFNKKGELVAETDFSYATRLGTVKRHTEEGIVELMTTDDERVSFPPPVLPKPDEFGDDYSFFSFGQ